jgi:hypothetical protein
MHAGGTVGGPQGRQKNGFLVELHVDRELGFFWKGAVEKYHHSFFVARAGAWILLVAGYLETAGGYLETLDIPSGYQRDSG